MISFIKGTVDSVNENYIVLDCGGMGYTVFMPNSSLYAVTVGEEVKINTYLAVREDDISLFGFVTTEELEMFKMLITVSGVGPKAALAVLSSIEAGQLMAAISAEDVKLISKCKGIGSKTAQKIIVELKEKTDRFLAADPIIRDNKAQTPAVASNSEAAEAINVLTALGFGRTESTRAIAQISISEGMTSSEIVSEALKVID